jgi:hypothetical protein
MKDKIIERFFHNFKNEERFNQLKNEVIEGNLSSYEAIDQLFE